MCCSTNAVVNNSRLVDASDKSSYTLVGGMQRISVKLQPASDDTTLLHDGQFGMTYIMLTTMSGFQISDKVTVLSETPNYDLKIVSKKDRGLGISKSYRYVLFRGNV